MAKEITDIDCMKMDIVTGMFIKPADQNYIVSRWCFLNCIFQQFYWNLAQAIEKYLKATLLLNGYSSKKYNHDLEMLFDDVTKFCDELVPKNLTYPSHMITPPPQETTREFICRINKSGNPSIRYNVAGYSQFSGDLYKADSLIFSLRRIADYLDGYAFLGSYSNNGGDDLSTKDLLLKFQNYAPCLTNSYLSEIVKKQPDLKNSLLKHNIPFKPYIDPEYKDEVAYIGVSSENSKLYMNIFYHYDFPTNTSDMNTSIEVAHWVLENIYLSREYINEIELFIKKPVI